MKPLNSIFNSSKKNLLNDHFDKDVWTSIEEMPIYNWNKVTETGDLTFLYRIKGKPTKRLIPIWENLQQQHLDEFGISDEMMSTERLMLKLIRLNQKFISTRDRVILNFIKIAEFQLAERAKGFAMKFGKILIMVQKSMGFRIDPKKYSVYEWYYTLKNLRDGSDKG